MVTYILMGLNVLVFLLMCLSGVNPITPAIPSIFDWGGISAQALVEGQWWRLFTYAFVHIGIFHLLANMYALFMIGRNLERLIGKGLFIMSYVVTGIFAGLCSFLGHKDSLVVSAGASGAIAGIFGVFFVLLLTPIIERTTRLKMLKQMGIILAINVSYGLSHGSGVDHYAHIGGLLSGALLGGLLTLYRVLVNRMPQLQKKLLKVIYIAPTILLLVVVPSVIKKNSHLTPVKFIELAKVMDSCQKEFEDQWLQIDFDAPDEVVIPRMKELIFPEIERTEVLIAEFNRLKLAETPAKVRDTFKELISLRNKRFLVLLKVYEEGEEYLPEFEKLSKDIEDLVKGTENF